MPKTCNTCRRSLERGDRDEAKLLAIEYEATMAAMEAVLHHYRILALRLERLIADAGDSAPWRSHACPAPA